MNYDSSLFFGGGGFGGINKSKVVKTVFVPIITPTQPKTTITEHVYKEPITRKRTVRKRATKKKAPKKTTKKRQPNNLQSKKTKIEKFINF